jgi:fructose-1,6-bisphosphatase/inositol monophosphatase family enzyme
MYKLTKKPLLNLMCYCYVNSLVACGELSGSIGAKWAGPWDVAAVKIIVEEAGGKVTDLNGKEQRYDQPINGAIISNGILHDEIFEAVKKAER